MLQNPQTSHHSQESMRDALVVLTTYLQNPTFQRQILDLAFQELLKKIFEILAEVFPSPEVILQAIITPLSVTSTDGQSNEQKPNPGTIFLDRSNKLRVLIQGFVNSMNKVEKTAIGCFAPDQIFPIISANGSKKSKGKKGGNKDDLPSPDSNQICNSFVFTVYWNELFQHLFPAVIRFQELWSPRIVQLLSSNPSYEPVKRSIYGPSYSESLKKCKLSGGGTDDPRHAEIRGEHALKDQLYLLFSVFCKTLSVAGKQFVLHPLLMVGGNDSQLYQWMQQMVMNAVFMDNHLYSVFMKYVVESLSMSCLPMTRIMAIPLLTVVMQSINKRLTFAWNGGPGQSAAIANMEENQFYVQLYHQCNIITSSGMCLGLTGQPQTAPQFSSDQVGMVKEAFIREVTGVIVESLSIMFGIKGDLAPIGGVSASSNNNNTGEDPVINFLEARRNLLWSIHLGNATENAGLLNAIKSLLVQLLSVPDGATVRQALLIVNLILKKSESELTHLETFVTSECFRIVLKNLIHMVSTINIKCL
jgi:hypothetical protein